MGQRLVVTIHAFNEDIAKIYYHWSAYSISALMKARDIINGVEYMESESVRDLQLKLIRFVESEGGCIDGVKREQDAVQSMFPNEKFIKEGSRNNGLIALTPEGMEDIEFWSEGDLTIDFDDDTIYNTVFYLTDIDEINEYRDEDDPLAEDDITEIKVNPEDISFENLDDVINAFEKLEEKWQFDFKWDGNLYSLIA